MASLIFFNLERILQGNGTVEDDHSISDLWRQGDTGKGRAIYYEGHAEIPDYMRFLPAELPELPLDPRIHRGLEMRRPASVYWSACERQLALFNFSDNGAAICLADNNAIRLEPYEVKLVGAAGQPGTR